MLIKIGIVYTHFIHGATELQVMTQFGGSCSHLLHKACVCVCVCVCVSVCACVFRLYIMKSNFGTCFSL